MSEQYHLYTINFTVGAESGIALVACGDPRSAFLILKNSGSRNHDMYSLVQCRDIGLTCACTYGLLMEAFVNAIEAYNAICYAANRLIGPRGEQGPAGPKGDKGDKGDPGESGTGTLDCVEYGASLQSTPSAPFCHVVPNQDFLPGGNVEDYAYGDPNLYLSLQRYSEIDGQSLYADVFTYGSSDLISMDNIEHTMIVYALWYEGVWSINKYEIPRPVNPDWNADSGLAKILNKPTVPELFEIPIEWDGEESKWIVSSNMTASQIYSAFHAGKILYVVGEDYPSAPLRAPVACTEDSPGDGIYLSFIVPSSGTIATILK